MKILSIFIFISFSVSLSSQTTFSTSFPNGEGSENGTIVTELNDAYYFEGRAICFENGIPYVCFWIYKADLEGNELWRIEFNDFSNTFHLNSPRTIMPMADGSILLLGAIWNSEAVRQPMLMNISEEGEILWTSLLDNENPEKDNVLIDGLLLESGNFILMGWENSIIEGNHLNFYKFSPNGELLNKIIFDSDCVVDDPGKLTMIDETTILLSNFCASSISTRYPAATKIDTSGNVIWTNYFSELDTNNPFS